MVILSNLSNGAVKAEKVYNNLKKQEKATFAVGGLVLV
jgi:hypothetical protein